MSDRPVVTVVVPTLNEAAHIDGTLEGLAKQTYPAELLEVLVVDGGSSDDTVARATAWRDRLPGLRVLDNPKRITPAAFNIGIEAAEGSVIIIVGAHSIIGGQFVERHIAVRTETGADVVGGPTRARGTTPFGEAVAIAMTSVVGVGTGRFHFADSREVVDSVSFGSYDAGRLHSLGGFDENLAIGQDAELNYRIRTSGGTVVVDPSIEFEYTVRSTPRALARQMFRYGQAKVDILRKHGEFPTLRPFAPAVLVATTVVSIVVVPFAGVAALTLVGLYLIAMLAASLIVGKGRFIRLFVALVTMHYAYGSGVWWQLFAGLAPRPSE